MKNKLGNALKWIISIFQKHEVPFQITGGLAANIYGSKRPVNDIDIDVPEDKMELLLKDIERYITFGPAHCEDERWDVKLIKLNYKGQEIDISGAFEIKIFDEQNKVWIPCPAKFETAQTHTVYGIQVPIVSPQDLIEYKKLLVGKHQKEDIEAVKKYISSFKL
ncbi:MAG: nucleotidyltransferase [Patescibacteria group bacterium]